MEANLKAYAEQQGLGLGKLAQPLRAALTGQTTSPDFPGAGITLSNGVTMDAMNANGYQFSGPFTGEIEVITNNPATPVLATT